MPEFYSHVCTTKAQEFKNNNLKEGVILPLKSGTCVDFGVITLEKSGMQVINFKAGLRLKYSH